MFTEEEQIAIARRLAWDGEIAADEDASFDPADDYRERMVACGDSGNEYSGFPADADMGAAW